VVYAASWTMDGMNHAGRDGLKAIYKEKSTDFTGLAALKLRAQAGLIQQTLALRLAR